MDEQLRAKLQQTGQEHVLTFWERLDPGRRQALARQIDQIDLRLIQKLTKTGHAGQAWAELARRAQPPAAIRLADRPRIAAKARRLGHEALAAGQVGLVIVAGGQGTRLGFPHPKGMFPIGPVAQSTLFRILLEKTLARGRSAAKPIPVYLMTSPATHDETVKYLAANDHFGLADGDVTVFCQGTMPAVDARTHKLLLADHGSLSLSPDGHGGLLSAFVRSGRWPMPSGVVCVICSTCKSTIRWCRSAIPSFWAATLIAGRKFRPRSSRNARCAKKWATS